MPRRLLFAALCCLALAAPLSASANDENDNACSLIAKSATVKQILGGTKFEFVRNLTAESSPQNGSGVLHSVCNGYIYSGPRPTSHESAMAALLAGTASVFAIDTWEPDDQSPYVDKWVNKGFSKLVSGGISNLMTLPGLLSRFHAFKFTPQSFGIGAKGILAKPFPGVTAGGALWWKASEAEAVFVSIGAGPKRQVPLEINPLGHYLDLTFGMLG